jgi:uncharacterized NAD-dependent epimerase/dehydratase family protein
MTLHLFVDNYPYLKEVADTIGCSYQNIKKIASLLGQNFATAGPGG